MFSKAGTPDARLRQYDHVIIHVTATPPDRDLDDKDIDQMHRARGFSGCGYNALIKRDGTWLDSDMGALTRPIGRTGAHVGNCGPGWNRRSFGVSLVGGVDSGNRPENNMTDAQFESLSRGIHMFMDLHPLGFEAITVMGHRDLIAQTNAPAKACPCFDAIPWWAAQVSDEDVLAKDRDITPVSLPDSWKVKKGDSLGKISSTTGVSINRILGLNPTITDPNMIKTGQVIRLS
ncbi:MAG: N-acetylmuramoyl-L-alanine amidase [Pseudomonadota bacterium]